MNTEQSMLEHLEGTFTSYPGAPWVNQNVLRETTDRPVPVDKSLPPETPPFALHRASIMTLRPMICEDLRISLDTIKSAVSAYFNIPVHEFISPRREKRLVNCRMVYYWLARELTLASFPMIGRHCGHRDHSTVMNGIATTKRFWKRFEPAITKLKMELRR